MTAQESHPERMMSATGPIDDVLPALERLASAAILAPSGDNTQPWHFELDVQNALITLSVDESRDRSPMNAGQRMSRIAVGAALENVLQIANMNGWAARVHLNSQEPGSVTTEFPKIHFDRFQFDDALRERVTNRRFYDGRPLSNDQINRLRQNGRTEEGLDILWLTERDRIETLAAIIAKADAILFGEPILRAAFLDNVRFDEEPNAAVAEGLSLDSLELAKADRFAFRLMPRLPAWLLRLGRIERTFAKHSKQLVRSASGLCVIAANDDAPETDFRVGQTLQRLWLALTRESFAVQPMMSIPVLENVYQNGPEGLRATMEEKRFPQVRQEFQQAISEIQNGRPAFVIRFGFAAPPSGRTGRLPTDAVVHHAST